MELTPLVRFVLLLVRPGMLVAVAPGFNGSHLPHTVKIALVVFFAIAMVPSVPLPNPPGEFLLTLVIAREAAIGLSLAFVLRAVLAGAELAGHLSGHQIGFSYAATVDPQSGVRNNVLATLYSTLAVLTFLGVNGHHALLKALAESYRALPIGMGHLDASLLGSIRQILGVVFIVGARLAAPVVVVLLVVELAIGLVSRTAPSLNVQVIGYPVRVLIGLALLAALVSTVPAVTSSLWESALQLGARTALAFR